jgi:hypothetical protein
MNVSGFVSFCKTGQEFDYGTISGIERFRSQQKNEGRNGSVFHGTDGP